MKYADATFGLAEAVFNKLGGMEGVQRFLRDELAVVTKSVNFPTFKTIKLGTQKDAKAIRKAITNTGGRISNWADDMMSKKKFTVAKKETEVELVVASVAELGFKDGAKYSDICERAKSLGLNLCPAEVGPQLRLQYLDQPKGEWLCIAMEPITDSVGGLNVFNVEHDHDGLWLHRYGGRPYVFWFGCCRFVFVRSK